MKLAKVSGLVPDPGRVIPGSQSSGLVPDPGVMVLGSQSCWPNCQESFALK